jgi:hypothetical protein
MSKKSSTVTKNGSIISVIFGASMMLVSGPCLARKVQQKALSKSARIVFLHHSTGKVIWNGGVKQAIAKHNKTANKRYRIEERAFPKSDPYGWNNYPYDYWNIWVKHAGAKPYKQEPTLEMLTRRYQVIVFKHCFPVSNVTAGKTADINSADKTLENYKAQYLALRAKLRTFKKTRFIVWTGAALVKSETTLKKAKHAKQFADWVKNSWDEPSDNIYVWDFRKLETEGTNLFLSHKNAKDKWDSHPNKRFAKRVAPLFAQRIVDVIEGRGDSRDDTGKTR